MNKTMKTIVLAALLWCTIPGSFPKKRQHSRGWRRSVNTTIQERTKTLTPTGESQTEAQVKSPQLSPELNNSSKSLWKILDQKLHAQTRQGYSALPEVIQMIMSNIIPENKWELYYIMLQALYNSQLGDIGLGLQQQLPQLLLYIFQETEDFKPLFALAEELLSSFGVNWKALLLSMQEEACYFASSMNGRSLSDFAQVFLASSVHEDRSRMWMDGFNIPNLLLSFIGKVQQILSFGLKTIWHFFSQNVFPFFDSYLCKVAKQISLKLTDIFLEGMFFASNIIKLDEMGQCPQGSLNQLLNWGRLHNLSWNFEAVPLDVVEILKSGSAAHPRATARVFQLISNLPDVPINCGQDLWLWTNRTVCGEALRQQSLAAWLPGVCGVVRGLAARGAAPLMERVCRSVALVSTSVTQGANLLLQHCASRGLRSRSHPPARQTRQLGAQTCDYGANFINSTDIGYCSVVDEAGFRRTFCGNASLLDALMKNPAHSWLEAFCSLTPDPLASIHAAVDVPGLGTAPAFSVAAHCRYQEWAASPPADHQLLAFCASEDGDGFSAAVCSPGSALKPLGLWLCGGLSPTGVYGSFCQYGRWEQEVPDPSIVALCRSSDPANFNASVCGSASLLHKLSQEAANQWLPPACGAQQRCRYEEWLGAAPVPPSLVALCRDFDPSTFDLMVCTSAALLAQLLADPANAWLRQVCAIPAASAFPELGSPASPTAGPWDLIGAVADLCHYGTWARPAAVDSTVVALCFNSDAQQFNIWVCQNPAVLKQLLNDPYNLWLVDFCGPPSSWEVNVTEPAAVCQYGQWADEPVDPYLVDFCWWNDQANFSRLVCQDQALITKLLQYPENAWLQSLCNIQATGNTSCRYEEWTGPSSVDPATVEYCSQYDVDNFVQIACDNSTRVWELLNIGEGDWLAAYCAHTQVDGIDTDIMCRYSSWTVHRVDPTTVALCFDHDQDNFNTLVCRDPGVLHTLTSDPDNSWVEEDCLSISNSTTLQETEVCPVQDLISSLQWTCSQGTPVPCPHQLLRLADVPALVHCGLEHIGLTLGSTVAEELTTGLTEAINNVVLGLVALEDDLISSLQLVQNARNQVLYTVIDYLHHQKSYKIKREVLQCFGSVLLDLVQKEGGSSGVGLVKEYMKLSASDLRVALFAIDIQNLKQLLYLLNTSWKSLQIPEDLKRILALVFFNRILLIDPNMFQEFVHFLPRLTTSEIRALPLTLDKEEVMAVVNQISGKLSDDQKAAFVQWILASGRYSSVSAWPLMFLTHVSNLLAYLPFESFQLLSRTQILTALDMLLANKLTTVQERFLSHTILKGDKAIGTSDFERLGRLICSASSQDLKPYKQNLQMFVIIKEQLLNCIDDQIFVPNELLRDFLVRTNSITNEGLLVTNELLSMVGLLPILGLSFIKQLHAVQIQSILPELSTVNLSSAQARAIIDKILQNTSITEELLDSLGSTVVGLRPNTLRVIPPALLMHILPSMAAHERKLSPVQKLIAVNKLWESDNINFFKKLDSLTKDIPLISLRSKVKILLSNADGLSQMKWSVQQAQMLFGKVLEANGYNITEDILSSLGFVAQGVDCATLKQLSTPNTFLKLLQFFRDLLIEMPVSLRSCLLEVLNSFVLTVETVQSMRPQLLFDLQLLKIRRFSINITQQLLQVIVKNSIPFLKLPSSKQSLMVDWIVQVLNLYGSRFTKAEFDLLGFAIAFIADEIFMEIPRTEIKGNLVKMKDYCFDGQKKLLLGDMLIKDTMFGDPANWTSLILDKVDRLLFFLPIEYLQKLPKDVLILERIEMLFHSQKQWEDSEFGSTCQQAMEKSDRDDLFRKQRILLQTAVGLLNTRQRQARNDPVLTCSVVRTTLPSAWTIDLLTGMAADDFTNCLEMIGQDPNFQPFELFQLLERVKQIYRLVSVIPPQVIEQLGRIATQFSEKDLSRLDLSDLGAVAALGKTAEWTNRKLTVLFTTFLRVNRLSVEELDSVTLVALGHVICGIKPADMAAINPVEFSMAVLWIGSLSLSCEESQLHGLAKLVTRTETFGDVSQWRAEEFIEIGSIAAGLLDMVLSSLVKEQIEGLSPIAIATLPPKKLSVVFSPAQIRMFNYQQAVAVTPAQLKELGDVQKKALDMVLTSWHRTAIDIRGRSPGRNLCASFNGVLLCLICSLLHTREEARL